MIIETTIQQGETFLAAEGMSDRGRPEEWREIRSIHHHNHSTMKGGGGNPIIPNGCITYIIKIHSLITP